MPPDSEAKRAKAIPDHPAVYRFLSAHSFPPENRHISDTPIVFLHIPKTGGTYLTDLVIHNLQHRNPPDLFYFPHWRTVAQTAEIFGPDSRLALVLRDPVARFVSAWNSRLHQGKPGYNAPWTTQEARVFARYPDLSALIRALASPLPKRRRAARRAVEGMRLVPRGFAHAFGDVAATRAVLPRICLCLPLEHLSNHLDTAMATLGFESYDMPPEPVENRGAPTPRLNWLQNQMLRWHLRRDYAIYRVLRDHAKGLHGL